MLPVPAWQRATGVREAPAAFVAACQHICGAGVFWRFNEAVSRWEFVSQSAAGMPVSQFFGWFYDPKTNRPYPPDPLTGLHPYRDLTPDAQTEILAALQKTYLGNPHDGAGTWNRQHAETREHNASVTRRKVRQYAALYADAIVAVDLRRPWLKHASTKAEKKILRRNLRTD